MITNSIKTACIVILLSALSCSSSNNFDKTIESSLATYSPNYDSQYKQVVIIPGAGCKTCISNVEDYFKHNIRNDKNTLVIVTQFANIKMVRINLTRYVTEAPNVYIDRDNVFNSGQFESLYPLFVYLKEGKVVSKEYASPQNPNALENYISTLNRIE